MIVRDLDTRGFNGANPPQLKKCQPSSLVIFLQNSDIENCIVCTMPFLRDMRQQTNKKEILRKISKIPYERRKLSTFIKIF